MHTVRRHLQAFFSTALNTAGSGARRIAALALAVMLGLAGAAVVAAPAYAITIDFSAGSLDGSNGFDIFDANTTDGNCPYNTPPCSLINNTNVVLTVAAQAGTFDLDSFTYRFQGTGGVGINDLVLTSNLGGLISIIMADTGSHLFTLADTLFKGVTWIAFQSEVRANVRVDSINVVPVPAGIALGAVGLGMLGLMRFRRKKNLTA